jgi:Domain of Unknown Function (DUF1259)
VLDAGHNQGLTRRRALAAGGSAAAGMMALRLPDAARAASSTGGRRLPVKAIERIVQIPGTVSSGVLDITVSRDDIGHVHGPEGVIFLPDFEIHGDLYFQPLPGGRALLNGDLALKPDELERFIDALLAHGLVFQAFHQHLPDLSPMVWFMHFRGVGDPLALARAVHAAIATTATPLPQHPPANPSTPLDVKRLERILHGSATVGADGVVSATVPRTDHVTLGGVHCSPETGISTTIEFKPTGGSNADVVPDFSMKSSEVQPVMHVMRSMGWFVGCLYNQETDEQPQLYFSHQLKSGNAYQLAHEVRRGLDRTASA